MTDSMTNNDLDSYGVWVKRSGNTNVPTPANQEAEISDFGMGSEIDSIAEDNFSTSNFIDTPEDDSPFEISDDTIAALDEPIGKDELVTVSDDLGFAADEISEESSEAEIENMLSEDIPADIDISNTNDSVASIVPDEEEDMSVPVFEDSMFEPADDMISFETDDNIEEDNVEMDDLDPSENLGFAQAKETENETSDNVVLQQIMSELAELKSEIALLKNNFEELKNKPVSDFVESAADTDIEVPSSAGGFFADDDEDDTISLSGDELSNIMSSANFSEPEVISDEQEIDEMMMSDSDVLTDDSFTSEKENSETVGFADTTSDEIIDGLDDEMPEMDDLSVDVEKFDVAADAEDNVLDNIEETIEEETFSDSEIDVDETISLDDISEFSSATGIIADDNLPDEISVSKIDDIMVESSDADFLDSVKETDETNDIGFGIPEELPDDAIEPEQIEDEDVNYMEEVHLPDDHPAVTDLMSADPEIHESITDNHMDYLKTDENATFEEDLGAVSDEQVVEAADNNVEDADAPRSFVDDLIDTHDDDSVIPTGLKSEIKSVLLYMDQLLESLPEEKIVEFAQSEQFNTYKKLFSDLGLS